MKNKKSILCLIAIAVFSVAAFAFALNPAAVNAATNRVVSYTDDFTGERLSDKWITDGAELNCEYSALSLVNFNLWGPSVNLVNHRVEKNSVITFEAINIGGGASWLGFAFGMTAPSSRVYYADGLIVMSSSANAGTSLMTKDGAELSQKTMNNHEKTNKTVFSGTNVKTTVVIKIDDNGDITLSSGLSGGTLNEIIKFSGAFTEGYIGFAGMGGTSADITSFKIEKGGAVAYSDDFMSSKIGYTSTGTAGFDWFVSYYYGEDNAYIEPSNNVKFTKDAILTYADAVKSESDKENQSEISAKIRFSEFKNGSYFGLGCGLGYGSNRVDDGNFVGIYKTNDRYYLAHIAYGKIKNCSKEISVEEGISAGYTSFKAIFKNGDRVAVTVNDYEYIFDECAYDGYFAFGGSSDEEYTVYLDDVTVADYSYYSADSDDTVMNFNGVKREYDAETDEEYVSFYLNKYEYYVGTQIKQSVYRDKNKDGYLNFTGTTETSVFVPKRVYGESIIRFDIKVTDNAKTDKKWERIGVCFGLTSAYFKPTSAPFFCFQRNCIKGSDGEYSDQTVTYGANMSDYFDGNAAASCEYNIWEDTETVYNVMLIVENGEVRVYYKKDGEPNENMEILRRKFKNASTYGYIGFFGYNGASFRLDNVSVTNINPNKKTNETANVEKKESAAISTNTLLLSKVRSGENGVLKLSVGGKKITLSGNGATFGEGITVLTDDFKKQSLNGTLTLRVELFGNEFTVGIRNGGSENKLYIPVITGTIDGKTDGNVTLAASGDASVITSKSYSLDGKIQLENVDYDEEYENYLNPLKVKPEKVTDKADLTLYIILGAVAAVVVIAAAVALPLILRRKKEKKA